MVRIRVRVKARANTKPNPNPRKYAIYSNNLVMIVITHTLIPVYESSFDGTVLRTFIH